jgi:photosystem II stability/assembly factor-like uncharacterized protein
MRKYLFFLVLVLVGCDGSDDGFKGQPTADQHAPNIFNLELSPGSLEYMEGGGSTLVTVDFGYNDAGLDIKSLMVEMPDGSVLSIEIEGPIDSFVGKLTEQFTIATDEVGLREMELWLVDSMGDASPHLSAEVLVYGDPFNWRERMTGLPNALNDVAVGWLATRFIAVGDNGTILTSPDGLAWTSQESGTDVDLHAVACVWYLCYVVGDSGTVLSSWDGENWESRWDGPDNISLRTLHLSFVLEFAAGTDLADDVPFMMKYDNATDTWTEIDALPVGGTSITGIAAEFGFPSNMQVATQTIPFPDTGTILTSADGLTWVEVAISAGHESTYSVLYDGERFWVGGTAGHIYSSPDGVNWTAFQTPAFMSSMTAMVRNGSMLVAHGTNDFFGLGNQLGVITEDAGATWQTFEIGDDYETRGLAYADGRFVSVGRTLPAPGQGAIFSTQ